MTSRCIVFGCSNYADLDAGISVHISPPETPILNQWKRFVRSHRGNFHPQGKFGIYSKHFANDCFVRAVHIKGQQRRLVKGAVPTIWGYEETQEENATNNTRVSEREQRGW